jgi:serine/threonine protein phosphatase PrpC
MNFLKKVICDSSNKKNKTISNNSLGNNGPSANSLPNIQYQNMNSNGSSAKSSLFFQENVNPNKNLKSSYLASTKNNINTSRISAYGTHTVNPQNYFNKSNKIIALNNFRKKTESSGKLLKSKISPKHNKVVKDNGNKIKNIDMNDDCQDTMKDDDSNLNMSWNNPKNNLKTINTSLISNNKQSINTNAQPKQSVQSINNNLNSRIPIPINTNNKSQLQPRPSIRSTDDMKNRPVLNDNKSVRSKKEDESRSRKSSFSVAPFQKLSHSEIFTKSYSTGIYIDADTTFINPMLMKMQNRKGKGFKYCSDLSRAGKDAEGKIKIDQDTPLISLNVGGLEGFNLFGVLDGHGQHGHFVSQFLKDYFINRTANLVEILKTTKSISTTEELYTILKIGNYSFLTKLYSMADLELTKQNAFDYKLSGTTCNIVFQFNSHLVCLSVGDSRGILVFDQGNNTNQGIFPLSTDQKPDLPIEYQRIQSSGGYVEILLDAYGNKTGPARVFKPGTQYPGLAMSRSLGDLLAKECGVISTPQIVEYEINTNTKYMVICSDGIWEFIKNEQVRDLGNLFYPQNKVTDFCIELVNMAMNLWSQFETTRDDITVVSVFF